MRDVILLLLNVTTLYTFIDYCNCSIVYSYIYLLNTFASYLFKFRKKFVLIFFVQNRFVIYNEIIIKLQRYTWRVSYN